MPNAMRDIFKRPSAEFPPGASQWPEETSRRDFVKLMAASLALAGVTGCSDRPDEKLIPYVNQPEGIIPGEPVLYASAMPHMDGYLRGVLVTTREGRPIKVDGNPDHPATLGGSDVFMQASVLSLYDPSRSRSVTVGGQPTSWSAFVDALKQRASTLRATHGRGLRILTPPTTSPTFVAQMEQLHKQFPETRWIAYGPLQRQRALEGAKLAFGRPLEPIYHFDKAKLIVSLDSDFLTDEPGSLRYARDFADTRRVRKEHAEMSRLYVVESTLTLTGAAADHRVAMRPSEIANVAGMLLNQLRGASVGPAWLKAIADDLKKKRGQSIVIAGEYQPPHVHAVVHAINSELGNASGVISYIEPHHSPAVADLKSLRDLTHDLNSGEASTLLILGGNPAATVPADIRLCEAILAASNRASTFTAHLGMYHDATAAVCQWHLPESHYLETWGDGRAYDGTASIIQPTINPLFGGKSQHEVIDALLGRSPRSCREIVQDFWKPNGSTDWWNNALRTGVIPNTVSKPVTVQIAPTSSPTTAGSEGIELVLRPDPNLGDGSFANNAWLQELPRPFTKLVWDNAALIAPTVALKLNLTNGDVVRIESSGRSLEIPAMVLPGLPDGTVTLHLGSGGEHGVDVYPVRSSPALWSASATITRTGAQRELFTTNNHFAMSTGNEAVRRDLVHVAPIAAFRDDPKRIVEPVKKPVSLSLYQPWDYSKGHQWAMSIDTAACIGCNACVVACQAENNIPVVGKDQVSRQREMHWIRIDSYFTGSDREPTITHLPTPCMQCENAPCEYVCPSGATTHSVEGLNQMTYNRCVGTRYCSNNCPYKVRRFNFLSYANSETTPERAMQRNPEVTVRTNGVMEKCTYCVQRLQRTRIQIERSVVQHEENANKASTESDRKAILNDSAAKRRAFLDSLQTACQQACPTRAIIFGDIHERGSAIVREKAEPHDYSLLEELNTKPRTTYLARISNPNPDWPEGLQS